MSSEISSFPTDMPVAAPLTTELAGINGGLAAKSVVRVVCTKKSTAGTGFLHKSGWIITANHVISGCSDIVLLGSGSTTPIKAKVIASDSNLDLALLEPDQKILSAALTISTKNNFSVGAQLSTWGFPSGYTGQLPLLSVGFLSGVEAKMVSGHIVEQWVVNAAFNGGNSGGPLLDLETGEVIGVVASKLAPLSPTTMSALEALSNQASGLTYEATLPDGTKKTFVEGQVISMVLYDLRAQVQLVIGKAVKIGDLRSFLKTRGSEP